MKSRLINMDLKMSLYIDSSGYEYKILSFDKKTYLTSLLKNS
jgi:hypothetical protein